MLGYDHSDATLVMLTLAGDQRAYEALVTRYERAVMIAATSVAGNSFMAEDAAQDAFVSGWMKLNTLADPEKFAPWVRYVFFITDDQKPEWLNMNHPKLKWIKHTDYIPEEYLPAFSSHVIEWNMHRIEDLSENFVYFNDDMFVIDKTSPEDFFRGGLPCDRPSLEILHPRSI